jgi:hypothetical protein
MTPDPTDSASWRPAPAEYAAYFERYVTRVPEADVLRALEAQPAEWKEALSGVSEERSRFRYAPDKWSIRQVLGHMIDVERVFGYRALSIARSDARPLPGFEENDYAASSGHGGCSLASLHAELEALRRSHALFFRHLPPEAVLRVGSANGNPVSVRALAVLMVGHARHHFSVLSSRYDVPART